MIKVLQDQALARWDTLPDKLRVALYSDINTDFLWKTCEAEHVPKEKIYNISAIAGYVLLGFIHPGDMAQELQDSINLNPQTATSLANAINERIFNPIKADLDKIYEPPSALAPKPVVEIKPAPSQAGAAPSPTANIVGGPKHFEMKLTETPLSSKPIGDIKPPVPSAPSFIKPEARVSEPPPTMLHEEPLSPSSKFTQRFKIDIPQPKLSEIKPGTGAPARPAVLELGETKPSTQSKMGAPGGNIFDKFITNRAEQRKPGEENARVVHYSEFKTPLAFAPASAEASAGRPGNPFEKSAEKTPTPPMQKISPAPVVNRVEPEREIKEITGGASALNISAPLGVSRVEAPKPGGIPAWAKPPQPPLPPPAK